MTGRITQLFILIAAVDLAAPVQSHAYLDPGTGSFALQIIIGSLLAAAFAIKAFWFRIKSFFGNLFSGKSEGK